MSLSREQRLQNARVSLEGLSVGDCFGGMYFVEGAEQMAEHRLCFAPVWDYTDDTLMSLSVFAQLRRFGEIDQDSLARDFAFRYDDTRGYGPSMHRLLEQIRFGVDWRIAACEQFGGQGSWGNGAAMRAAPIGAYFADDLDTVATQAQRSAEVTHAHSEGIAGAIAVAVAAAIATKATTSVMPPSFDFLDEVTAYTPDSLVRAKIRQARDLPGDASVRLAAAVLGTGLQLSAQDTVPFALWSAATRLNDYEEAQWRILSAMGDRDTTCAIVGGIVACHTGIAAIPDTWRTAREPLPDWPFMNMENTR